MKAHVKVPGHPLFLYQQRCEGCGFPVRPVRAEALPVWTGRQCVPGPSPAVSQAQFAVSLHFLEETSQRHGLDLQQAEGLSAVGLPSQRCSIVLDAHWWAVFAGIFPASQAGSWDAGKPNPVPGEEPCQVPGVLPARPAATAETASILRGKEGAWTGSKMTLNISAGSCREGRPGTASHCRRERTA